MANAYMGIPIAITVEGANTLTRSLIIFGQGLTRSHPHLLDVIKSIQHGDDMKVRCVRQHRSPFRVHPIKGCKTVSGYRTNNGFIFTFDGV